MPPDRRELFAALAALGIGPVTFQRALAAAATAADEPPTVTPEMVKAAEWVAGVTLSDEDRKKVAGSLTESVRGFAAARRVGLTNDVPPAFRFDPTPGTPPYTGPRGTVTPNRVEAKKPDAADDLAFQPVTHLAHLLRTKQVSSVELTRLYLDRLRKYDPVLKCVVTYTEDLALRQARQADAELAVGIDRGPLHGVPWGAKDLIAVPGYKTTWGAEQYKEQQVHLGATVARRLEEAGAVLVAKLSLGALAFNDVWFGGRTNNPWNVKQGSSGSSAGSACAVAAGLVGFALGSETLGSIVSPSSRCGVTGLRPTFGRVSRHGCMALAWTMDKIGPMARAAEDCALVLGAVHGADRLDPTTVDRPFSWPAPRPVKDLRVGYVAGKSDDDREELKVLKGLGVTLVPITLPRELAGQIVGVILNAEAGAAFDELVRGGALDKIGALWPAPFRAAQFVTAVDYIRANRLRTVLMREMARATAGVDLYVGGGDLVVTNLTGHPTVCLPNGFRKAAGAEAPTALTFTGRLYGEADLLAVAKAYQDATGHHLKRPPQEAWVAKEAAGEKK